MKYTTSFFTLSMIADLVSSYVTNMQQQNATTAAHDEIDPHLQIGSMIGPILHLVIGVPMVLITYFSIKHVTKRVFERKILISRSTDTDDLQIDSLYLKKIFTSALALDKKNDNATLVAEGSSMMISESEEETIVTSPLAKRNDNVRLDNDDFSMMIDDEYDDGYPLIRPTQNAKGKNLAKKSTSFLTKISNITKSLLPQQQEDEYEFVLYDRTKTTNSANKISTTSDVTNSLVITSLINEDHVNCLPFFCWNKVQNTDQSNTECDVQTAKFGHYTLEDLCSDFKKSELFDPKKEYDLATGKNINDMCTFWANIKKAKQEEQLNELSTNISVAQLNPMFKIEAKK